jgi:hypothetical protein
MQITFLPHAVLPRLVRHAVASAQLLVRRTSVVEQQQQRHQAAPHPLLADVDSESVQASIQRLFDASIMLEDSAFRFVRALCKLSSEMVSMQGGVNVGASAGTGEGVLDLGQ